MFLYGEDSNPTRWGQGQTSDDRALWLEVFGGEVLTAFKQAVNIGDKVLTKSVGRGQKSWRFPKTWKATTEYHTPGQEMLGGDIETDEITVDLDAIAVSHIAFADIDTMLTHFDIRSIYSMEMGHALAVHYDRNVARQIILASRTAPTGVFPGGHNITDAALTNTGQANGAEWIAAIRDANGKLYDADVPENFPRYCAVNRNVFEAMKYAQDSNGRYLLLNTDFRGSQSSGFAGRDQTLQIDDVTVFKTKSMPSTDESAAPKVYSKYRANYSTTTGMLWVPQAVVTLKVMDISFEGTRDTRRLEDFLVAKKFFGHGTLRPELAVEFRTATPS